MEALQAIKISSTCIENPHFGPLGIIRSLCLNTYKYLLAACPPGLEGELCTLSRT